MSRPARGPLGRGRGGLATALALALVTLPGVLAAAAVSPPASAAVAPPAAGARPAASAVGAVERLLAHQRQPDPRLGRQPGADRGDQLVRLRDPGRDRARPVGAGKFTNNVPSFLTHTPDEIAHGLWAQDYHAIINDIKNLGYNTIRIPFSNQLVEDPIVPQNLSFSSNTGPINTDLQGLSALQDLQKIVTYAGQEGLKVILDDHRSEAGESAESNGLWYTATFTSQDWLNDWVTLAKMFAGNPTVVGFDLRNEPHTPAGDTYALGATWGTGDPSTDVRLAYEQAGNAILAVDPGALIFCEGISENPTSAGGLNSTWWGGDLALARSKHWCDCRAGQYPVVLSSPGHVVYSAHDYGPDLFQQTWFNSSTTAASLDAVWNQNWGYLYADDTAPVWVGEFGTDNSAADIQSSSPGSQGQWFADLVSYLQGNPWMGWTYWALNGEDSYDLLDNNYDPTPVSAQKQSLLSTIQFSLPGAQNGSPPPTQVSCSAAYSLTNSWSGGAATNAPRFQGQVVLTNTGTAPISGWTLTWTFPGDQQISSMWTASYHPVRRERDRRQRALQRQHPGGGFRHDRLHRHVHQQRRRADQLRGQRDRVYGLTRHPSIHPPRARPLGNGGPVPIPPTPARRPRRGALPAAAIVATLALSAAGLAALSSPALAADTATINGATTYQTMAGFGASEGFGEAATVMNASSSVQQQALSLPVQPDQRRRPDHPAQRDRRGLRLDRSSRTTPAAPTATPNYLPLASIDQDQGQLWFAQQIKADYGVTNVFARRVERARIHEDQRLGRQRRPRSAASRARPAPAATGARPTPTTWCSTPRTTPPPGVPLTYLGPSNEANFAPSYDSMAMSPSQMASVLDVLGPTLAASGLPTQVECCATEGWDYAPQYAAAIEADPTAAGLHAVFTGHGYTRRPTSPLPGWNKPAWETEWSTFETWDPAWDDGTDASGLTWAQHIYTGLTGANLSAFLYWWGSTTPSENGDNEGLIQINGSNVAAVRPAVGVRQLQPLRPARRGAHRRDQLQQRGGPDARSRTPTARSPSWR